MRCHNPTCEYPLDHQGTTCVPFITTLRDGFSGALFTDAIGNPRLQTFVLELSRARMRSGAATPLHKNSALCGVMGPGCVHATAHTGRGRSFACVRCMESWERTVCSWAENLHLLTSPTQESCLYTFYFEEFGAVRATLPIRG